MRFTIKLKLFLTFGFMLAVLVGTATYGIISLGGLNTTLSDVLNGPAERLKLAQMLNNFQLQQIRQQKNMLAATNATETNRYIGLSDEARKEFDAAFEQAQPAEHRGQEIVEVVRHAAGQLPERFGLARLTSCCSSSRWAVTSISVPTQTFSLSDDRMH